jgi:hypothetical protein
MCRFEAAEYDETREIVAEGLGMPFGEATARRWKTRRIASLLAASTA